MELNLFSILVLTLSPILTFLVSISGHFDIKKDSSEQFFKDVLKKVREEKINIWRSLLSLPQITHKNSKQIDEELRKILSRQEQYDRVDKILVMCKKIFSFYYDAIFLVFIIGMLLAVLYLASYDFPENLEKILFVCSLAIMLSILFGGYFLYRKKQQLRNESERIISINLKS